MLFTIRQEKEHVNTFNAVIFDAIGRSSNFPSRLGVR